jgi:hypothetical protein
MVRFCFVFCNDEADSWKTRQGTARPDPSLHRPFDIFISLISAEQRFLCLVIHDWRLRAQAQTPHQSRHDRDPGGPRRDVLIFQLPEAFVSPNLSGRLTLVPTNIARSIGIISSAYRSQNCKLLSVSTEAPQGPDFQRDMFPSADGAGSLTVNYHFTIYRSLSVHDVLFVAC